jgi:hypothetical protein
VGAADLEVVEGIGSVNVTLVELPEDLLKKQLGEAFCDLLFLIATSQSKRSPLVEGFRRPSLRSGLLNPSTKGQFPTPDHLSPFELAPVSFCSRPDSQIVPAGDSQPGRLHFNRADFSSSPTCIRLTQQG